MLKIDLHTHSIASDDGGITPRQYQHLLDSGHLDFIAVTDHNQIALALQLRQDLGKRIIVGEEVMTRQGEIIGLFLKKPVKPNVTALETVKAIHDQGGLVYIPHPFETIRHGLQAVVLDSLADYIDIIEVHNGRAVVQNRSTEALVWAKRHNVQIAASSDAHTVRGVGHTYTVTDQAITKANLLEMLEQATLCAARPPLITLAAPKYNKLRKKLQRKS